MPRLIIFTRPLCQECQALKEEIGAKDEVTIQEVDGVLIYLLPPDNTPRTPEEIDALVDLDLWITTKFTLPVGVETSTGKILMGKDEILEVWKEGK